jgi:REP element-mobilizing transposase RayT
MPRQSRLDTPGVLHHVMIRGIERRNIFRNDFDRNDFIERLSFVLQETQTLCYAWSFMPNHAHFLIRSGPSGIAYLMRKLLTGYVVSFNRRHRRTGQLFQNRYKSIICQEETYFLELVRYIHLNPVRVKIVSTLPELDRYPYSGHSTLMGNKERSWQDTDSVLGLFSSDLPTSRKAYRSFIKRGIDQGKRDDLTGGGLIRSIGGWREIRNQNARVKGDQRILGDSEYVMNILSSAQEHFDKKTLIKSKGYTLDVLAEQIAALYSIQKPDMLSKGRQKTIVEARSLFCFLSAHYLGTTITDLARLTGMAPSAISYSVSRGMKTAEEKKLPFLEEILYN